MKRISRGGSVSRSASRSSSRNVGGSVSGVGGLDVCPLTLVSDLHLICQDLSRERNLAGRTFLLHLRATTKCHHEFSSR